MAQPPPSPSHHGALVVLLLDGSVSAAQQGFSVIKDLGERLFSELLERIVGLMGSPQSDGLGSRLEGEGENSMHFLAYMFAARRVAARRETGQPGSHVETLLSLASDWASGDSSTQTTLVSLLPGIANAVASASDPPGIVAEPGPHGISVRKLFAQKDTLKEELFKNITSVGVGLGCDYQSTFVNFSAHCERWLQVYKKIIVFLVSSQDLATPGYLDSLAAIESRFPTRIEVSVAFAPPEHFIEKRVPVRRMVPRKGALPLPSTAMIDQTRQAEADEKAKRATEAMRSKASLLHPSLREMWERVCPSFEERAFLLLERDTIDFQCVVSLMIQGLKLNSCFLSHEWGDREECHEFVVAMSVKMQEYGVTSWIDTKKLEMSEPMLARMIDGISKSIVFVMFLTPAYIQKARGKHAQGETAYIFQEVKKAAALYREEPRKIELLPIVPPKHLLGSDSVAASQIYDLANAFLKETFCVPDMLYCDLNKHPQPEYADIIVEFVQQKQCRWSERTT